MFKLKENIDLKELEKLGFYLEGNTYKRDVGDDKCIAIYNDIEISRDIILPEEENQEIRNAIEELDLSGMLVWEGFDAETMYYTTKYNINSKIEEVLKEVVAAIEKEATAGQFELLYKHENSLTSSFVVDELKRLGFKVKVHSAEIDDYGEYYPEYLEISWKNTGKEKENIFKRILIKIRRIFN